MFKRRPLGQKNENSPPNNDRPKENTPAGGFSQATGGTPQNRAPTPAAPVGQNQGRRRSRNRRGGQNRQAPNPGQTPQAGARGPQGGGAGQPGQGNQNRNQGQRNPRPRNQNQGQPGQRQPNQNSQNQNSRQQGPQRHQPPPRRVPPPPPAYIQRDVLLIPSTGTEGIETVRAKFDPLAKKIPAHVTLIFPEPADIIGKEFLKDLASVELPPLASLTFSQVIVHEEMYLWLLPDDEGRQKVAAWREALVGKLPVHSQDEVFTPHLTLGYIPRSITPEDAVTFAKQHVSLPLTLNFEKVLLEEFAENQISTSIDTILFGEIKTGVENPPPPETDSNNIN